MPNYVVETWFAHYGPAAMPDKIVGKINNPFNLVLQEPDAVARFAKVGLEPRAPSPAKRLRCSRRNRKSGEMSSGGSGRRWDRILDWLLTRLSSAGK
ncbi:hypothetical protein IVA83_45540 [Bradyrhizobium sp. 143]|nr:hypothetical protein [Bradyrhizobium sp. 143]MCK1725726.1 hypothetical protein [Bradyrhizobium sp. 142]